MIKDTINPEGGQPCEAFCSPGSKNKKQKRFNEDTLFRGGGLR